MLNLYPFPELGSALWCELPLTEFGEEPLIGMDVDTAAMGTGSAAFPQWTGLTGLLREARRAPDRNRDGTATWSLTTLQRALRHAPGGLPTVSTYTIWCVLHDAGFVWTKDRSWCETGTVVRKRKSGTVMVTDPDATPKKT